MQLTDKFGRDIKYLRLSVTDRCNLRCFYCMPEEGIRFLPKDQLLTYEEMLRLVGIFTSVGVDKIRVTGGEPFVRKDLIGFLEKMSSNKKVKKLSITTNGILTKPYLEKLKMFGIDSVNLSLDSLDPITFKEITARDEFEKVFDTFRQMVAMEFKVKINTVVMEGANDHEIVSMAELAREYPVSVRFIEEMPFNGSGRKPKNINWNYKRIYRELADHFTDLRQVPGPVNSTSENYTFSGAKGDLGIIAAYSRTFCGSCDRIRVTSTGEMRTCLYGNNVLDIKSLMRAGREDQFIRDAVIEAVGKRAKDGFEAESLRSADNPAAESMSVIGG